MKRFAIAIAALVACVVPASAQCGYGSGYQQQVVAAPVVAVPAAVFVVPGAPVAQIHAAPVYNYAPAVFAAPVVQKQVVVQQAVVQKQVVVKQVSPVVVRSRTVIRR